MAKIYIVQGDTGEYSDRREWLVAAYLDETKAIAHAESAKRFYEKHGMFKKRNRVDCPENPFDPYMSIDYTGTDWTVLEVELRDDLPEEKSDD